VDDLTEITIAETHHQQIDCTVMLLTQLSNSTNGANLMILALWGFFLFPHLDSLPNANFFISKWGYILQ